MSGNIRLRASAPDACVALKDGASHSCTSNSNGRFSLGVTALAIAVLWTIVLPWIGARPSVRARIEYLKQQGVDPAAMYYTDIEAMERVELKLATIRQEHPEAFW